MSVSRVGETVHYVRDSSGGTQFPKVCRAAIITEREHRAGNVSLAVLEPGGLRFKSGISYTPLRDRGGTWHRLADCHA